MTPELLDAINRLPDDLREPIRAVVEEGERARAAAMFEDMGYEECDVCQQASRRVAFRLSGVPSGVD